MVRYVPEKLWTSIVTFYPKAIALKKTKGQEQEWIRCHQCKNKKRKFDELRNWARLATSVLPQKVLQKRWKHLPQQLDELHLVHSNDMKRLWNFVKLITKKNQVDISTLNTFFTSNSSEKHIKHNTKEKIYEKIISEWEVLPLMCSDHKLVMNPLVFHRKSFQNSKSHTVSWEYTMFVTLLYKEEYRNYVNVVLKLYEILRLDNTISKGERNSTLDCLVGYLAANFHPKIKTWIHQDEEQEDPGDNFSTLTLSIRELTEDMKVIPAMCANQCCNMSCVETIQREEGKKKLKKTRKHKVTLQGDEEVQITAESNSNYVNDAEHIDVFSLRLLDIKQGVDPKTVIDLLNPNNNKLGSGDGPRRSTRKRKERYHYGPIIREDILSVRKSHNLAAVRLQILEKKPDFQLDQTLVFCLLLEYLDTLECASKNIIVQIPFEWNNKTISDVIDDATIHLAHGKELHHKLYDNIILILPGMDALQPRPKQKRPKSDECTNETLLDSLFQIANLQNMINTPAIKETCRRNVEIGFKGTFLHASKHQPKRDENSIAITTECLSYVDPLSDSIKSSCIVVDSDSEDSSNNIKPPLESNTTNSNTTGTSQYDIVFNKLVKIVRSSRTKKLDEDICYEVAVWACDANASDTRVTDLIDAAYAKYLELLHPVK